MPRRVVLWLSAQDGVKECVAGVPEVRYSRPTALGRRTGKGVPT